MAYASYLQYLGQITRKKRHRKQVKLGTGQKLHCDKTLSQSAIPQDPQRCEVPTEAARFHRKDTSGLLSSPETANNRTCILLNILGNQIRRRGCLSRCLPLQSRIPSQAIFSNRTVLSSLAPGQHFI